jgi:RNA polymerase sigma factor (sigma-70 family)
LEPEFERRFQISYRKIQNLLNTARGILSLYEPIAGYLLEIQETDESDADQGFTLNDLIFDRWNIEAKTNEAVLSKYIQTLLDQIPWREKEILNYRFGLNEHEESTLQEVADKMGVTRERIRQLENSALDRLRNSKHRILLEAYFRAAPEWNDDRGQMTGCGVGFFDKDSETYDFSVKRQKEKIARRYIFAAEIIRWRQMSSAELVNEIRARLGPESFCGEQTSLHDLVASYTSPEYDYRVSNSSVLDEISLEIDFDDDENDLQSELDE